MADRQDYARQCAADMGGVDEQQLEQSWCHRCIQVECVRSGLGKASRFEDRVLNWHERLFEKIPRMSQADPRFLTIARQGFATIDVGPVPEVRSTSAWHDPRDLAREQPVALPPAAAPAPVAAPARFVADPEPAVDATPAAPAVTSAPPSVATPAPVPPPTAAAPPPAPQSVARPRAPMNTPSQAKQMIERPVTAPALPPVVDPWSAPAKPSNPNEVVVPRGAKIKVGG